MTICKRSSNLFFFLVELQVFCCGTSCSSDVVVPLFFFLLERNMTGLIELKPGNYDSEDLIFYSF